MGCGISTDSASGVLANRVTANGRTGAANGRSNHLSPDAANNLLTKNNPGKANANISNFLHI